MDVRVRLLGSPVITVGETVHEPPPGRAAALLYYLAYRATWVARDELLYLFWPDAAEDRARASLRTLLSVLRRCAFAPTLEVERVRVRWLVTTDLDDPSPRSAGVLLDGFRIGGADEFDHWLDLERLALDDRRRAALFREVEDAVAADRHADAIAALDRWLLAHPLDEDAVLRLLTLGLDTGRREEALDRYRSFVTRLARDLDLEPSARLRDAFEALRIAHDRAGHPVAHTAPAAPAPSVPPVGRSAGFIGRDDELEWLERLLGAEEQGMVCQLVGPGGIGKSRLATEAARALHGLHRREVVEVALATATSADEALAMLASAVGGDARDASEPLLRAVRALQGRRVLVLLDNCEQVVGLAGAFEHLRAGAPDACWLLTSRERIVLEGAHVLTLEGLATSVSEDGRSPAEALFLDRARRSGGVIDAATDGEAVARLARLLGGMPLALELAAPWTRLLQVGELLRHLEATVDLPPHPGAAVEARHATLERVFETSWRRLDASLQAALARLTVFVDGCDVRAADAVAGVRLGTLARLRDASMLHASRSRRITQHPLVERFVRDRVAREGAVPDDVRERHARHYLDLLRRCEEEGQRGDSDVFETLQAEHGNVEAAWAYALERQWWEPLMFGGAVLGLSFVYAGRSERWGPLLRSALARIPEDHLAWAVLTAHEASLDEFAHRHDDAYRRRRQAVAVARRHAQPFWLAWVLYLFAHSAGFTGRGDEAIRALTEADELLASIDEVEIRLMVSARLHRQLVTLEDRDRRYVVHDELCRRTRSVEPVISTMLFRSTDLAESHGRHQEAVALAESAVARARGVRGHALDLPADLCRLASVCIAAGDLDRARVVAEEAIERGRPFAGPHAYVDHGSAVFLLAWTHALMGDEAAARSVLRGDDAQLGRPHAAGSMLEARWALERGDVRAARRHVTALAGNLDGRPMARTAHADHLELSLLDAEVSLAAGSASAAAATIDEALARASELRFLPLVLEALVVASGLVPSPLRERLRALAVRHTATAGPVRLRAELERYGARPHDLAGWESVRADVAAARGALAAIVARAAEPG